MKIFDIKSPQDILDFMDENIKYGWLDINGEEHIGNMKNFRRIYKTSSLEDTLKHRLGCCIEQVRLMSYLLDKINIKNKMFCTRIYEGKDFNNLEINDYYVKLVEGKSRPVTEFFEVEPNLSFKEFNEYINSLDNKKSK